jgi:glycine/D-amino acid oxidase-like deaminating enzyme
MCAMKIKVVGGGVFGLSAAAVLSQQGHEVALFEAKKDIDGNPLGGGKYEILHHEYGADTPIFGPGVSRGRDGWLGIELRSGRKIYHETGFLYLTSNSDPDGWAAQSLKNVQAAGYKVQNLELEEAKEKYPALNFRAATGCVLSERAGWLDAMEGLRGLLEFAKDMGVAVEMGSPVEAPLKLTADAVIIATGPHIAEHVAPLSAYVTKTRQEELIFQPADPAPFKSLPAWAFDYDTVGIKGAPADPEGRFTVSSRQRGAAANDGEDEDRKGLLDQFARHFMNGIDDAEAQTSASVYTATDSGDFFIDEAPDLKGYFVMGGGNGQAFKFGLQLGLWCADLLNGKPIPDRLRLPKNF